MLQIKALVPLLRKLKDNNINIAIETSLQVDSELVKIALDYVDEFIVDVKILDRKLNNKILHGDVDLYINNIELLSNRIDVFRIPLSYEYTFTKKNKDLIISFLKKYDCNRIEIFKIHKLAKSKYKAINWDFVDFRDVDDSDLMDFYNRIKGIGKDVVVIKV